jgi:hypothetical protein
MAGVEDEDRAGRVLVTSQPGSLAGPPRLRLARSLAEAAPGEALMIGARGQTLGPRQVAMIKLGPWATAGAAAAVAGLAWGVLFSPLAGVVATIATGALTRFQLRHWPALRTAVALSAAYRWEEAHSALLALEQKKLPRAHRESVQVSLGALDALLGRPEAALHRLDAVLSCLSGSSKSDRIFNRWRAAAVRGGVLAGLGRLDEARRQRDELAGEITAREARSGRPRGDFLEMLLQSVQLRVAFEADAPGELPDDATLHQWARHLLGCTQFGETLVSLAWAFHRRGDDDMARHLLAEAPSRSPRSSLPTAAPRLHAWAQERAAAWGLSAED